VIVVRQSTPAREWVPSPPVNRHGGHFGDDEGDWSRDRPRLALTPIAEGANVFAAMASAGSLTAMKGAARPQRGHRGRHPTNPKRPDTGTLRSPAEAAFTQMSPTPLAVAPNRPSSRATAGHGLVTNLPASPGLASPLSTHTPEPLTSSPPGPAHRRAQRAAVTRETTASPSSTRNQMLVGTVPALIRALTTGNPLMRHSAAH
jgi:hypothetical protein